MSIEQNNTAQINLKTPDIKVEGKKDQRNFATRHADGKAFAWIKFMQDKAQPNTNHSAA